MSKLNKGYGWLPEKPSLKLNKYLPIKLPENELPQEVDLRSEFPECYDQGQLGSCTANGIAAVVQHRMIVSKYKWQFQPSRLFIYWNERNMEGTVNSDAGANISDGIASINELGVCPEAELTTADQPAWLWPYSDQSNDQYVLMPPHIVPAPFKRKPSDICYKNAVLHKSVKSMNVSLDRATVLNTLAQNRPIVFGFTVYDSFESQETMDTGIMSIPASSESVLGGHCVVVVGYTLNKPMGTQGVKDWALVRNSWGSNVYGALKGHFYMPLDEVLCNADMTSDAHVIDLMTGEEHKA